MPDSPGPIRALAASTNGDRLALGDPDGALLISLPTLGRESESIRRWRRFAGVGGVNDLHFDSAGILWIASETGLWRLDAEGRLEDRSPGTGQAAHRVNRVRSAAGIQVVASDGGAFLARADSPWRRLDDGIPRGPVRGLALRVLGRGVGGEKAELVPMRLEVWLLADGDLWRLEVSVTSSRVHPGSARRIRIPGRPADVKPSDVFLDLGGAELAVLYPRALAHTLSSSSDAPRWQVDYPVLPPGARARSIAESSPESFWLATDRGLLHAQTLSGPWVRASSPAGSASISRLLPASGFLYAAGESGLLRGRSSHLEISEPDSRGRELRNGPDSSQLELAHVHQKALSYAGLQPASFRRLGRGLMRRGWWPEVDLHLGGAYDRDESDRLDESFSYGELHRLRDLFSGRSRDFVASIEFSWDLRDVAYPREATELSREVRQRISLRDNVLDEVAQLYFDRRRALIALESHPDKRAPEAVALRLRAEELAAGLDAWTGGWFGRQLHAGVD